MDRLNAVDKTLADFLDKVGWHDSLPLHDVQELAEGDEISKWFPKYQLCDSSDMHTGRTWGTSREDYPFPTTLKRSLGKESSSPRSSTTGLCTKLVKKSAQAHPF